MASTVTDIRSLAERHAREVCRDPESWIGYLDMAAKFYRYPFHDTFLIHAQRPEATACAEMPVWNKSLNRWINRGAKGIALIDDTGARLKLRYVFDIKDTHPVQGAKRIRLWQMNRNKEAALKKHLREAYGISIADREPMPQVLTTLAKALTAENIRQAMYDLNRNRAETYLASMGDVALLGHFTKLIEESIAYVLMKRCGYHPLEHMDISEFDMIRMFDDINVLPYLGEAVHTITEPVLMDIGQTITEMDREAYRKQLEAAPIEGQMNFKIDGKDVIFEMDKDMTEDVKNQNNQAKENKEDPYGKQQPYRVSYEPGLPVSEPDPDRRRDQDDNRERYDDGRVEKVPEGKKTERLLDPDADRETAIGEVITTTLLLPVLPSPEEQQDMITGSAENVTEKTANVEKNSERTKITDKPTQAKTKRTRKPTKETPTEQRVSVKTKLREKQAEADTINRSRAPKRARAHSKEAVI